MCVCVCVCLIWHHVISTKSSWHFQPSTCIVLVHGYAYAMPCPHQPCFSGVWNFRENEN